MTVVLVIVVIVAWAIGARALFRLAVEEDRREAEAHPRFRGCGQRPTWHCPSCGGRVPPCYPWACEVCADRKEGPR